MEYLSGKAKESSLSHLRELLFTAGIFIINSLFTYFVFSLWVYPALFMESFKYFLKLPPFRRNSILGSHKVRVRKQ
ncbi:hypothetical protein A9239_12645 [Methanosarcina sp. A14]|nr:hypothetical protein A9239_12645 [Methanosarcina sp. A14]